MHGFWKLTWVGLKLLLREPMIAFFTLVFPLMMLFVFGAVWGNKPSPEFGGHGMVDVSVPAWSGLIIATTGFLSLATGVAADRERGVFRRFRLTAVRPQAILGAQILPLFLMTAIGMLLLIMAARLVFGLRFSGRPLDVVAAFTLGSLAMFAIGFVVAGIAPTARSAQSLGMVLFYPMIFLSGATIPLEAMKGAIRTYAKAIPLTHVVTLLRGLWAGEAWGQHLTEVWVLGAIFLIGIAISAFTFRWE
jgi:ABC-2 type transport system permease protein